MPYNPQAEHWIRLLSLCLLSMMINRSCGRKGGHIPWYFSSYHSASTF